MYELHSAQFLNTSQTGICETGMTYTLFGSNMCVCVKLPSKTEYTSRTTEILRRVFYYVTIFFFFSWCRVMLLVPQNIKKSWLSGRLGLQNNIIGTRGKQEV